MAGFAFAFAMFLWLTAPPWLHGGFFCLVQCHSISIYFHNSSSLTTHQGYNLGVCSGVGFALRCWCQASRGKTRL